MKLIIFIISLFDLVKKRKIIKFFKKRSLRYNFFFDVGAHKGETFFSFNKIFRIKNFLSFEPSPQNFRILEKKTQGKYNNLKIFNYALGNENNKLKFYQLKESSSSTMINLNKSSNYFKKKTKILDIFNIRNIKAKEYQVPVKTIEKIMTEMSISSVDILKVDTEGYEFNILKGAKEKIKNIRFIYFEHHFDDMLEKKYTLSDIHNYLVKHGFKKEYKIKMYFRKTFEYIYENKNIINL